MKQVLRKTRRLPSQGRILYKVGDRVQHDTVVGELDYIPGPLVRFDVASKLGIPAEALAEKMVKKVNDRVEIGDALAINSQFFSRKVAVSATSGYLALWSRFLGYVYVREPLPTGPKEPITFRAEELGISKLQFASDVRVKIDSVVNTGQVIIGGQKKIVAPSLCRVTELSMMDGVVVLTPLFQVTELPALIDGVVAEIPEADTCVIASLGYRFAGAVGFGGERSGIIRPLLSEDRDLREEDLPEELSGDIVVARRGVTLEALQKLAQKQIAGLVLGCIDIAVLQAFSRREPLKYLGTLMDLPFPIVLMQGFGAAMLAETYQEIAALAGSRGALDGSTQLRAGVARPELLVALPEADVPLDAHEGDVVAPPLRVGSIVVLNREPYFGRKAEVLALEPRLQKTAAGTRASLATVRLEDGLELQVPLTNCRNLSTDTESR